MGTIWPLGFGFKDKAMGLMAGSRNVMEGDAGSWRG
jgi:hypothetical protein